MITRLHIMRPTLGLMGVLALASGLVTAPMAQAAPAATFNPAEQVAQQPGDALLWRPCPPDVARPYPNQECTSFSVPLDYSNPQGQKIVISMSRVKAEGPSRGVIFNNPGGPGGSALGLWGVMIRRGMAEPLHKYFDLVSVQPRGLEYSTPLRVCTTPKSAEQLQKENKEARDKARNRNSPEIPQELTKEEAAKKAKEARAKFEECDLRLRQLSPHVTTENTARDMDMARQYLGEEVVNYYGASYGTYLGAVYASLFPTHTGRFVLDSAVDPDHIWLKSFRAQGDWQRKRMYEMFQFMADHDDLYHLGDTPLKVYTKWYKVVNQEMGGPGTPRLDAPPAQVGDVPPSLKQHADQYLLGYNTTRPVVDRVDRIVRAWTIPTSDPTEHNLWDLTGSGFTNRDNWPLIAYYIAHPQPRPMSAEERRELEISSQVFQAVTCNENTEPLNPVSFAGAVVGYFDGADVFTLKDRIIGSGFQCLGLAGAGKSTPVTLSGKSLKVRPIVLQSFNDTQTPFPGAKRMAEVMDAIFVTAEGGDHGVYFRTNQQAWDLVNNYFLGKPFTVVQLPYATVKKMVYTDKEFRELWED